MDETTVPAWAVQMALGDVGDGAAASLRDGGVLVGRRVELAVGHLRAVLGDAAADSVAAYQERARDFFDAWVAGEHAGPYVVVRRPLVRARQQDTKDSRSDLGATLDALLSVPGVDDFVEELTGSTPDLDVLRRLGAPFAVTVEQSGKETSAELACAFDAEWPEELGGPATRGELRRLITLGCNHAAWRDRRNRRLVLVAVDAEEIWPDPAA